MERSLLKLVMVVMMVLWGTVVAAEGIGVDFGVGYLSKYIWRGQDLMDGEDALQGGVSYSSGGTTVSVWGYRDLGDDTSDTFADWEIDYTIEHCIGLAEGVELAIGSIIYTFETSATLTTGEVYAGLSLTDCILSPNLTVYYDLGPADGLYANLSGGYTVDVAGQGIDFGLGIGFYSDYAAVDDGLGDIDANVATTIEIGETGLSITPEVHWVLVDEDTINSDDDEVWFGVSAGYGI